MNKFERIELSVNGIRTVVLTAGEGPPLMFWHGAGTFMGFDFALPWATRFKLLIPFHAGFGDSGGDHVIAGMQDHVDHYLRLFDRLNLPRVNLAGFSMGGWMAASFSAQHPERVRKLALVAPAGLRPPDYAGNDAMDWFAGMPADLSALWPHVAMVQDADFMLRQYREMASAARLAWGGMTDPKLAQRLALLDMPVLLVWGDEDRVVPARQLDAWQALLPDAVAHRYPRAGHLVLHEVPEAVTVIGDFMASTEACVRPG